MRGLTSPHVNESKTPRAGDIFLLYSKCEVCWKKHTPVTLQHPMGSENFLFSAVFFLKNNKTSVPLPQHLNCRQWERLLLELLILRLLETNNRYSEVESVLQLARQTPYRIWCLSRAADWSHWTISSTVQTYAELWERQEGALIYTSWRADPEAGINGLDLAIPNILTLQQY